MRERYPGSFETEWEFMRTVLEGEGIPEKVILREDKAQFTYENAVYSKQVTDAAGIDVCRGIICCQSHHARRCLMYYQLVYPETDWILLPSDTEVSKDNWFESERGIRLVLGEMERCGTQFSQILNELRETRHQKEKIQFSD